MYLQIITDIVGPRRQNLTIFTCGLSLAFIKKVAKLWKMYHGYFSVIIVKDIDPQDLIMLSWYFFFFFAFIQEVWENSGANYH